MNGLRQILRLLQQAAESKPGDMSRIGKNYGSAVVEGSRQMSGAVVPEVEGAGLTLRPGNMPVIAAPPAPTPAAPTPAAQGTADDGDIPTPKSSVFIVAKRSGKVDYPDDQGIPDPPDEDEKITIERGGSRPPGEPDQERLEAFLRKCVEIRGDLPSTPSEGLENLPFDEWERRVHEQAQAINTAFRRMLLTASTYGVTVTIVPADGSGNADWDSPHQWTHLLENFAHLPMWVTGTVLTPPIEPRIPIYNDQGHVVGWRSPREGDLMHFAYCAFYLQIIPPRRFAARFNDPIQRVWPLTVFWGFDAAAYASAVGGVNAGDPNRRPSRQGQPLITPIASQYAIGDGSRVALSKVTVEFDREHVGTFPLTGGGCDVILANDMNCRKIRYSHGAIVADYLMTDSQVREEYPSIFISNQTEYAEQGQENTPKRGYRNNCTHPDYRNRFGINSYGDERFPNIAGQYRHHDQESNQKVDILFDTKPHQVIFNETGVDRMTAYSPQYQVNNRNTRTYAVHREVWMREGLRDIPAIRQRTSQSQARFTCYGLGLTAGEPETLPATQFDPGAAKYTRNLPNMFLLGSQQQTDEWGLVYGITSSGWRLQSLVFYAP